VKDMRCSELNQLILTLGSIRSMYRKNMKVVTVDEDGNLVQLKKVRITRALFNKITEKGPHFFARDGEDCDDLVVELIWERAQRGGRTDYA
jgi:hypothetical protein